MNYLYSIVLGLKYFEPAGMYNSLNYMEKLEVYHGQKRLNVSDKTFTEAAASDEN